MTNHDQNWPGPGNPGPQGRQGPAPYSAPPVPPQQAPGAHPPHPGWAPAPAPVHNPWHQFQPPKPQRRGLWITLAGVVVLAVTAAIVIPIATSGDSRSGDSQAEGSIGSEAGQKDLGSGSVSDPARYYVKVPAGETKQYSADVPGLSLGPEITDEQLSTVDPRQLLWAVLTRQGQKQVTDTIDRRFSTPHDYDLTYPSNFLTTHSVIDWRTRQFADDSIDIDKDDKVKLEMLSRCVGSAQGAPQSAVFHGANAAFGWPDRWEHQASPDMLCKDRLKPGKEVANSGVTDGLAPAGLSTEDMNKFLSYVDHVPGLIEAAKPAAVTGKDGKKYVRLDVKLVPQDAGVGIRVGVAFLNAAFAQTGKSPFDFPYSINIGNGQGFQRRYFLDPATLLPVYSVTRTSKPLGEDGRPDTSGRATPDAYTIYEYAWPDAIDPDATRIDGAAPNVPHRPMPFDQVKFPEQ